MSDERREVAPYCMYCGGEGEAAGGGLVSRQGVTTEGFGDRLWRAREAAGMTVADLARASGWSEQCIRRWEQGWHLPSLVAAVDVAQALGTTVERLVDGEGRP